MAITHNKNKKGQRQYRLKTRGFHFSLIKQTHSYKQHNGTRITMFKKHIKFPVTPKASKHRYTTLDLKKKKKKG